MTCAHEHLAEVGGICGCGLRFAGGFRPPSPLRLWVWPCTVKAAKAWVAQTHRHLERVNGGLFASSLIDDAGQLHAVAIAGTGAPEWEGTGRMTITRVASDGVRNGCSMLYASLCQAGKALGYVEAWTYTLPEEGGAALRAAGVALMGLTKGSGKGWEAKGRARMPAVRPEPKSRWRRVLRGDQPFQRGGVLLSDAADDAVGDVARKCASGHLTPDVEGKVA